MQQFKFRTKTVQILGFTIEVPIPYLTNLMPIHMHGYKGCLVNRTLSISVCHHLKPTASLAYAYVSGFPAMSVCMHPSDLSKDTSTVTQSLNYLILSILQTIIHVEHNVI